MLELIHTSAQRGLDGARPGYAVVAATVGITPELSASLEGGSAVAVQRIAAQVDPEPFAVYRIWSPAPRMVSLSRIVPIAADYSGRPARLAHHVVLSQGEASGPTAAALLLDPSTFRSAWAGDPRQLPARAAPLPAGPERLAPAVAEFARLTEAAQPWIRHLSRCACGARDVPRVVLVPPGAPVATLLAAILGELRSVVDARIETSDDHAAESRPSLLVLPAGRGRRGLPDVLADWSSVRGTVGPPAAPTAPGAATPEEAHAMPALDALPAPLPARITPAMGDVRPPGPPVLARAGAAAEDGPRQPTAGEALSAFAIGAAAGAGLAVAAIRLVF